MIVLGAAAGGFAVAAVLVAVFWPSAPPLTVRPKADAQGKEALEITCASCPDGTKITIRDVTAMVQDHTAVVALATELSVGENPLKVLVDRPGNGRDETLRVVVHVAYRVRPDLATLQGDRPAISIVADAAPGTSVALGENGGKPMQLVDGRGLEKIDVVDALTGISDDVKTLSRQVPYVVTSASGATEAGVVSVSVGIVPLHIDAPGTRVTTDQPSFVLAGHTLKGAEVIAAGRPIPVKPDGTFAQVMNVSSVGATQIEVRAKMPDMAPRLLPIRVRRVDSLDVAAKEFMAEQPLDFHGVDAADAIGKPVLLGGEVLETRRQGYQTISLLDVGKSFGCAGDKGACNVRLVQGGESSAKKGDKIRAYGRVGAPFTGAGKPVPEVLVEFTQKGARVTTKREPVREASATSAPSIGPTAVMPAPTRSCLECKKDNHIGATLCVFCGHPFAAAPTPRASTPAGAGESPRLAESGVGATPSVEGKTIERVVEVAAPSPMSAVAMSSDALPRSPPPSTQPIDQRTSGPPSISVDTDVDDDDDDPAEPTAADQPRRHRSGAARSPTRSSASSSPSATASSRRIGRGGMGIVYKVEHIRDRQAPRDEAPHRRALAQPRRGAALQAGGAHRLQALEPEHRPGLRLRRGRGPHLPGDGARRRRGPRRARSARDGPMPFARLGKIVIQVCARSPRRTSTGIVHRDIKPENIMLMRAATAAPTSPRCSTSASPSSAKARSSTT